MEPAVPFVISNSADDSQEGRLAFNAPRRRASGLLFLADAGLRIQLDDPARQPVVVPYEDIGSVVFTPGLMRNRLRLTARRTNGFGLLNARHPSELTALIGRRHRDGAREFVTALRLRIADAMTPPVDG
jgi:hypothetical protein